MLLFSLTKCITTKWPFKQAYRMAKWNKTLLITKRKEKKLCWLDHWYKLINVYWILYCLFWITFGHYLNYILISCSLLLLLFFFSCFGLRGPLLDGIKGCLLCCVDNILCVDVFASINIYESISIKYSQIDHLYFPPFMYGHTDKHTYTPPRAQHNHVNNGLFKDQVPNIETTSTVVKYKCWMKNERHIHAEQNKNTTKQKNNIFIDKRTKRKLFYAHFSLVVIFFLQLYLVLHIFLFRISFVRN